MTQGQSVLPGASQLTEFGRYFDLSLAMTRKQRALVYQIRYRVYCEEFGYEPASDFSGHQEMDEFDCQSVHCLATHRESGITAGCVRLVLTEGNDKLPIETHAGDSLDQAFMDGFSDRRHTLCEISRLAVESAFRRRRGEERSVYGNINADETNVLERRTFPVISLALIIGAGAVADILDRKNCFSLMEPSLPLLLKRAGMHFKRVGEDFDFRGLRAAYYGNMNDLFGNAPPDLKRYFSTVREQFVPLLVTRTKAYPVAAQTPPQEHRIRLHLPFHTCGAQTCLQRCSY